MSEAVSPDPAIHRRRLRTEIRNAREAAGMTQRDVAKAMDWSQSKLIRIESGQVNISTNDLRALLSHYGLDPTRINALVAVARAAREPGRWSIYRDVVTPEFIAFLGCESSASIIRGFEPFLIPGLLQTEEYARTVLSSLVGAENRHKVDSLVDLRVERQELLVRQPEPSLHFIMDEAVIRRVIGGRDVMRRQLRHLQELAEHPEMTVRVIPFEYGIYPNQRVAYHVFEFSDPEDEYVLYIENPELTQEAIIRESSPEQQDKYSPANYLAAFWELEHIASREDAVRIIHDAVSRLTTETDSQ
ncbi:MAG: helix-turn-helix transcriptional regulator [Actinomycetota bacterium]|nr:helix-turn-helix transcriptional regulator [Actinomycetota bacterium]